MSTVLPSDLPTAPLPALAVEVLGKLESAFASPVERLRIQIARLENSLRIQCAGRDSDLAQLRNPALTELERAELEGSFQSTAWEILRLQGQLREYRAELAVAVDYEKAAVRAADLAARGDAGHKLSGLEWDDLAHAEDMVAGAHATLAKIGRLDLIGGAA